MVCFVIPSIWSDWKRDTHVADHKIWTQTVHHCPYVHTNNLAKALLNTFVPECVLIIVSKLIDFSRQKLKISRGKIIKTRIQSCHQPSEPWSPVNGLLNLTLYNNNNNNMFSSNVLPWISPPSDLCRRNVCICLSASWLLDYRTEPHQAIFFLRINNGLASSAICLYVFAQPLFVPIWIECVPAKTKWLSVTKFTIIIIRWIKIYIKVKFNWRRTVSDRNIIPCS